MNQKGFVNHMPKGKKEKGTLASVHTAEVTPEGRFHFVLWSKSQACGKQKKKISTCSTKDNFGRAGKYR